MPKKNDPRDEPRQGPLLDDGFVDELLDSAAKDAFRRYVAVLGPTVELRIDGRASVSLELRRPLNVDVLGEGSRPFVFLSWPVPLSVSLPLARDDRTISVWSNGEELLCAFVPIATGSETFIAEWRIGGYKLSLIVGGEDGQASATFAELSGRDQKLMMMAR